MDITYQKSMMTLGKKAAKDIISSKGEADVNSAIPQATAEQRAAFEQGRRDAHAVLGAKSKTQTNKTESRLDVE